ncbi:hypothetical protein [Sporosarcina sp. NPDC096371]|uniref:hypothetical protein n=1 Tax=Sporosarcina sp. NPDC096371 TaxID=3364530 RepID=UPI003808668F
MATKKRKLFAAGLLAVLLASAVLTWFYFSKPTSFPANDQLVETINNTMPQAEADMIQDSIYVDAQHVFVPFISKKGDYGVSYWVWQKAKQKWKVGSISTSGEPLLWRIDKKDPSTYYFVWNIHPDDQLDAVQFYLVRDRGYHISDGKENYFSKVQMEKKESLQEKSYGVLNFPDEWVSFINPLMRVESAKQPNIFFTSFYPEHALLFSWISYDRMGQEKYPERTGNGSSHTDGGVDIDYVNFFSESAIE